MEFHIVWPSFWWNIVFAIACVVFILVFILNKTRENDKSGAKINKRMSNILLNKHLWAGLCLLSFLASFVLTLYLLHNGMINDVKNNPDVGLVLVLYVVLGIIIPLLLGAFCADSDNSSYIECGFIFAAGNSFIGLIFLVCNVFSYMWVALGFLIFDILGVCVANYIDED